MCALKRESLQDGIYFSSISDKRFKTNRIAMNFIVPLSRETAAQNALLSYLMRKSTAAYPDFTEFSRYLTGLYGAYADGSVDKMGDSQVVTFSVGALDDRYTLEGEPLTQLLSQVLCDMVLHPALENGQFPEKEIALEKNALCDTIRAEINDKRAYAVSRASALMCQGEPFGLSRYGTVEEVMALTGQQLIDAYHHLLETARVEVIFAGSGCAETAKQIVAEAFSGQKRSYQPAPQTVPHLPVQQVLEETEVMDVNQSKMVLGFSSGLGAESSWIPAFRVMTAVFGGTPMSKLFLNVREKMSLCYYCAARPDRTKGIVRVDCGVENVNIQKARAEILNQLEEMKQGNITEEEISHAVMSLVNSYKTLNDSNVAISGHYLGEILTNTIRTPEEEAELIRGVTKEQIVEMANKLHLDICYVLTGKEGSEE
ncbi:MAG: EF-P 5-aminopentanol modification-associated protein YfmF [Massiliimalia sp.]|jgi:predicted Zn-dependent peptidase